MAHDDETNDEQQAAQVGYKRPPVHSRWKKGQSGNPRGSKRRNGFFDVAGDVFGELLAPAAGLKNNSAYARIYLRQCIEAIKGNNRALFNVIDLVLRHEAEAKQRHEPRAMQREIEVAAEELQRRIKAMIERRQKENPKPPPPPLPPQTPEEKRAEKAWIKKESKRRLRELQLERRNNKAGRNY